MKSYASVASGSSEGQAGPPIPAPTATVPGDFEAELNAAAEFLSPEELELIKQAMLESEGVAETATSKQSIEFPTIQEAASRITQEKHCPLSPEELEQIQKALWYTDDQELDQIKETLRVEQDGKKVQPLWGEDIEISGHSASSNESDTKISKEELDRIEQARRDEQDEAEFEDCATTTSAAAAAVAISSTSISEDELAAIERAIKEADEAEEAQSMQLAIRMQEEDMRWQQQKQVQSSHRFQGNVRTMTREELRAEERANEGAHTFEALAGTDVQVVLDEEDGNGPVAPAGFRMNSSIEHQWSRLDQNSIVGPNKEVRTKHDSSLDSQANLQRLGLEEEMSRMGNRTFNSFKQSMKRNTKKGVAAHGTGRAGSDSDGTKSGALDAATIQQVTRAINAGLINKLNGVVKEGKEAVIYHADKGEESGGFDVAVKMFKRIQDFRNRGEYVDGDPRFDGASFNQTSKRQQLNMWTEKEFRNLVRANRAGVPVPTPLMYKENVLFMRFMGTQGWPAPQLRESGLRIGSKKWVFFYEQVMNAIRTLYVGANLVHGDLSEYNIMIVPAHLVENMDQGLTNSDSDLQLQAILIDFGQAVDVRHPRSLDLLERDLQRVLSFFARQGVTTMSQSEALTFVSQGVSTDSQSEAQRFDMELRC